MPETWKVGRFSASRQHEPGVGQNRERQVQPLDRLALVAGVLGRKPVEPRDIERLQLGKMIAERARLRRAAARPRDGVPPVGRRLPGLAGARIDVDDRAAAELRQIDRASIGRRQRKVRKLAAGEMARGAVILRGRQIGRKHQWIVRRGHGSDLLRERTLCHRTPARGHGPVNYGGGGAYEMNSISDPSGSRK